VDRVRHDRHQQISRAMIHPRERHGIDLPKQRAPQGRLQSQDHMAAAKVGPFALVIPADCRCGDTGIDLPSKSAPQERRGLRVKRHSY
jgi:hypothetical protein